MIRPAPNAVVRRLMPFVYGLIAVATGCAALIAITLIGVLRRLWGTGSGKEWHGYWLGTSAAIVLLGGWLCALDLFVLLPRRRRHFQVSFDEIRERCVTVVPTAYNDEANVSAAVKDFRAHPLVRRVIVVDNNGKDGTAAAARSSGANVVIGTRPGYGRCVFRALTEGTRYTDTELTLLCEGDCTFRAFDMERFLAYIPHADIVKGTRIVEQLRAADTQLKGDFQGTLSSLDDILWRSAFGAAWLARFGDP